MYICNHCKRKFEEPEEINTTYESLYGISSLFPNSNSITLYACPYCNSNDVEEFYEYEEEYEEDEE